LGRWGWLWVVVGGGGEILRRCCDRGRRLRRFGHKSDRAEEHMTYLSTARERGTRMVRLNVRNLITAGAVGLETDMTGLKEVNLSLRFREALNG